MKEIKTSFPIAENLKKLGLDKELYYGACTGQHWLNTGGKEQASYSPADGKKIGTVKLAVGEDYGKWWQLLTKLLKRGARCRHRAWRNSPPDGSRTAREQRSPLCNCLLRDG
ncbi:MAG: hypothetical protein U5L09_01925 [Bacteroidales bacterium]|nr:hypothetical protein [Bacteroidales bacterium]